MATPKKPKKSSPAKTPGTPKAASAKPASAAPAVANDIVGLLKGFQVNTLAALGLAVVFVLFQVFPYTRYIWLLNIAVAAAAGFLFWRQTSSTSGLEQKVCRYGLLAVAALFVFRDIFMSEKLAYYVDKYGDVERLGF